MVIVVDSSALVSSLVDLEDGKWVRGYTSGGHDHQLPLDHPSRMREQFA